ncbi:hypothetical protein KA005_30235 [bacterium]|nr:hypothetical protein [bacterium]
MNKSNPSSTSSPGDVINPQPKRLRWIKTFGVLFILFACTFYPILKIRCAHNQVKSFCAQAAIGMPVQGLEAKAEELGLKILLFKADGSRPARITVWKGWAFARWFCEIEHANGKVVRKETYFLD